MRQLLVVLIAILSIPAWGDTPDFDAGQLWAYKTRAGEEDSRLLIDKVEDVPKLGKIFHISLSRIHLKDSAVTIASELPHLPVSLKTLTLSCTTLVGHSEPNPMYLQGYEIWKKAFDAGQAGVYTISVAEILDTTEALLKRQASAELRKSNYRSSGRAVNIVPELSPCSTSSMMRCRVAHFWR